MAKEYEIQRYTAGYRTLRITGLNCHEADEGSFLITFAQNGIEVFTTKDIEIVSDDTLKFYVDQTQSGKLSTFFPAYLFLNWFVDGERKAVPKPLKITVLANHPTEVIEDDDQTGL